MKALILAGGKGTRLRPLTHSKVKPIIPIGGIPMIERAINDVREIGIIEIIININEGEKDIPELLGDGSRFGCSITYIEQKVANGMMYPILMAKDYLKDDDFVLYAGDNILSGGLKKYYDEFKLNNSSAHLLTTKVSNPERFGVAVVEGNKLIKTVEKPNEFVSDLAVTAIYFYKKDIITAMENISPVILGNSSIPEYYPPLAHQWLIENGYSITITECTGWWKDTGKPDDLLLANELVLENITEKIDEIENINSEIIGKVIIENGAKIINSKIIGPVFIGKNCIITNSTIDKYSAISHNTEITDSVVSNSIIQDNTKIFNTNEINLSLIGSNVILNLKEKSPKKTKFYLGDHSELESL